MLKSHKMKTAIVFCPYVNIFSVPPLAPALLKSFLVEKNIECKTIDFNLLFQNNIEKNAKTEIISWFINPFYKLKSEIFDLYCNFVETCAEEIAKNNTEVLGISVFSHESQKFAEDLCYSLKKKLKIHILLGGSGVRVRCFNNNNKKWGELMLDSNLADCVLSGEGELLIVDLIKNKSIGWHESKQLSNDEISDLPVPNFDDYDLDAYGKRDDLRLPITASKGCVRSCTFCDVAAMWPKYRYRRGENVADEMIGIYEKYGIRNFAFTDSLINGGLKPFREMNIALSKRLPNIISYSGQFICRDERSMAPSDFELMKIGGCKKVSIGIESGSENVRNHMKKQFSNDDIDYTAHQLLKNNIFQTWNIIVGYPTETIADWQKTIDLIKKFSKFNNLIKISPIGVFQLLQNTPITESSMLSSLDIEQHITNGYSEYNWISKLNPTNTLKVRISRWFELVDLLEKNNLLNDEYSYRLDEKKLMLKQQLKFYEETTPNKTIFPIFQNSLQNTTDIGA